ncbi:PilZ domain-containing protein [Litoribrevibacter euphylliae]|uniref:PilZ domain-containing protein n=1 Tax=Litoribrevibacter euphylliae TaxID=1834034 RepID=A0ABV7H6N2_9GAMM
MLTNPANQRKHTRFQPRQVIYCQDLEGNVIGRIMNLSETGFMLMSEHPAEVNESQILRMDLPLTPPHQITATCETIWCQKSSYSQEYGIGMQIAQIDDLAVIALQRYLGDDNKATAA